MASSDKEDFISEASTNCLHTSSFGTSKCGGNVCNVNEVSYFSASQKFDHSASNVIQHVPRESPKSKDFDGTNDKQEEYDGDQFVQQFNNIEYNQYDQSIKYRVIFSWHYVLSCGWSNKLRF
jgi:hypothetical protein